MNLTLLQRTFVLLIGIFGCLIAVQPPAQADIVIYPGDANIFNVKECTESLPYCAKGDGVTDDTAAIQRAINDIIEKKKVPRGTGGGVRSAGHHTLYFPNGTYRVTGPLTFGKKQPAIEWGGDEARTLQMQIHIKGQSRAGAVIRLDNGTFTNASSPQIVLSLFDEYFGGNDLFSNTVEDITIDVGSNNPGAIALNYHNNNVGYVRRVTLKSGDGQGATGLQLGRGLSGIGTVMDVAVQGFDYGITNGITPGNGKFHVTYTLERITLSGQRIAGIRSQGKGLSVRRLTSANAVPALVQDEGSGQVVIIDSKLSGGASQQTAINNVAGWTVVRNVQTSGYGTALRDDTAGQVVIGPNITEYVTGGVSRLWDDAPTTTLNLSIQETPDVARDPQSEWAVVSPSGDNTGATDTQAIQAAIDSGKTTVFLKRGRYWLNDTIRLRNNVHRFNANWSAINITDSLRQQPKPVFLFENGNGNDPVVVVEAIDSAFGTPSGSAWFFQHNAVRTLVLRDLFLPRIAAYRNAGTGRLFVENVCSGGATTNYQATAGWSFKNQQVWARHINHEGTYPHFLNDNGKLWILGFKSGEAYGPAFVTQNGGQTEVLGGIVNTLSRNHPEGIAMIVNDNSDVSISLLERSTTQQGRPHDITVREIRGGEVREFPYTAFPKRADSSLLSPVIPLYRGRQHNPTEIDPTAYYEVRAKHSNKCLDVFGYSFDDGAQLIQWTCWGGENQQWQFVPTEDGYYKIVARHSGKVVDVFGVSQDNLTPVIQWGYWGGSNQQWKVTRLDDGTYQMMARHSGKVLDVNGGEEATADAVSVIQYEWHGGTNQRWLLLKL